MRCLASKTPLVTPLTLLVLLQVWVFGAIQSGWVRRGAVLSYARAAQSRFPGPDLRWVGWARPRMHHTGKHIHMRTHTTRALTYSYGFRLAFAWAAALLQLLVGSLAFSCFVWCWVFVLFGAVVLGLCALVPFTLLWWKDLGWRVQSHWDEGFWEFGREKGSKTLFKTRDEGVKVFWDDGVERLWDEKGFSHFVEKFWMKGSKSLGGSVQRLWDAEGVKHVVEKTWIKGSKSLGGRRAQSLCSKTRDEGWRVQRHWNEEGFNNFVERPRMKG